MDKRRLRNDLLLVAVFLLIALVVFIVFKLNQKKGKFVKVIVDKEVRDCYNFNDTVEVEIKDGEHTNVLVIENGEAYIKSANCPDKICVAHRKISHTGETIVCLPHKLVIEITEE